MKNPLNKRLPRELKQDFGKYIVIFTFLILLIALVSGFLISTKSCEIAYYEGMDKYNVEHGHLTFQNEPTERMLKSIEEKGNLTLYDLSYINVTSDQGKSTGFQKSR